MKIVMLGHSGVGKTTYVASMYKRMQEPVGGLSVRAEQPTDHQHLLKLAAGIRAGAYPDATASWRQYELVLRRRRWLFFHDDVYPFRWVDYRGGALFDQSDEEDAQQLEEDLESATGILAFFDITALHNLAHRRELGRLTVLLTRALSGVTRPVPVAMVLTKSDLVARVTDAHFQPLAQLATMIRASQHVVGCQT